MVDASVMLDAVMAISIAAGAIFAVWELRGMSRTRQTELVIHLSQYVNNPEFMNTYLKIWRAEAKEADELERACSPGDLAAMVNIFETLAYLVRHEGVDARPVRELMGTMTMNLWDKVKPFTMARRKDFSPDILHNFEWLANEFKSG